METKNKKNMTAKIEELNSKMIGLVIDEELLKNDQRYLLQIIQDGKIGMINHEGEIVVKAEYDKIPTQCFSEDDYLCVWKDNKKGVVNTKGQEVIPVMYDHLFIGHGNAVFSVQQNYKHAVVNAQNEYIVEPGIYDYIGGFEKGFARVGKDFQDGNKKNRRYGVIDVAGNIVIPIQYTSIWNFYDKDYPTVILEKDGVQEKVRFDDLKITDDSDDECDGWDGNDCYDDYGTHYGDFAGTYAQDYAGYDDDTIYDAFDGDPDAYWNID